MDAKTQKMQDKVAKLLRQAEGAVGTPEEAVFQARAFEIMAKYGLDMAQVEAHKQGLDVSELPNAIKWQVVVSGKYVAQQALLLHGLARALHCKTVYSSVKGGQVVYVFGVSHHIDRVQFLWEILRPQMLRLVETVRPEEGFMARTTLQYVPKTGQYEWVEKSTSGQLRQYRRSWIAGFSSTIETRVREQENKAVESAGGGALVLYKGDAERAAVALQEAFPKTKSVRPRARFNPNGYAHGQRDAASAAMARGIAS